MEDEEGERRARRTDEEKTEMTTTPAREDGDGDIDKRRRRRHRREKTEMETTPAREDEDENWKFGGVRMRKMKI